MWKKVEMVHHISQCIKLAQNDYKTRHDWVGKVIKWKSCKQSKFYHVSKWYKHKPESIEENKTHKIFLDIETNQPL